MLAFPNKSLHDFRQQTSFLPLHKIQQICVFIIFFTKKFAYFKKKQYLCTRFWKKVGESVAQQVEHIPFKDGVLGSSPSWFTEKCSLWERLTFRLGVSFCIRMCSINIILDSKMSKYRLLSFMILFRNFFAGLPRVVRGSIPTSSNNHSDKMLFPLDSSRTKHPYTT